jgi:hypothetical protein
MKRRAEKWEREKEEEHKLKRKKEGEREREFERNHHWKLFSPETHNRFEREFLENYYLASCSSNLFERAIIELSSHWRVCSEDKKIFFKKVSWLMEDGREFFSHVRIYLQCLSVVNGRIWYILIDNNIGFVDENPVKKFD